MTPCPRLFSVHCTYAGPYVFSCLVTSFFGSLTHIWNITCPKQFPWPYHPITTKTRTQIFPLLPIFHNSSSSAIRNLEVILDTFLNLTSRPASNSPSPVIPNSNIHLAHTHFFLCPLPPLGPSLLHLSTRRFTGFLPCLPTATLVCLQLILHPQHGEIMSLPCISSPISTAVRIKS